MSMPFGGENFLGDLLKIIAGQGADAWKETARQLALSVARGDDGDPNPDPAHRTRLDALTPLVARHLATLLAVAVPERVDAVTRSDLAVAALADWTPLLERSFTEQAPDLGAMMPAEIAPMLSQMSAVIGPLFGGFQLGSAAGHFTQHAWSLGVLALPRRDRVARVHLGNIAAFAADWSLDLDTALTFTAAFELAAAAILSQPGVADATGALLLDALADARQQQRSMFDQLGGLMGAGGFDPDADPATFLDSLHEPTATPATLALEAYTATLREWCLVVASDVTTAMVGSATAPLEAVRRHIASDARGEEAAAALFGLSVRGETVSLAREFVHAIVRDYGRDALDTLTRVDGAPTQEELRQPSAWFERVTHSPLA